MTRLPSVSRIHPAAGADSTPESAPAAAVRDDAAGSAPGDRQSGRQSAVLVDGAGRGSSEDGVGTRTVVVLLTLAAVAVVALVAVTGSIISKRLAEQQAIHDAAQLTDSLATSVVQPALTDPMADSPAAAAALAPTVRRLVAGELVRMKLWAPDGTILYSDEPRLVGQRFALDDEAREAFTGARIEASISDLSRPENAFERSRGSLLEVYRPVWTPDGSPLLLETYLRYDAVSTQAAQLWRGFSGVTLSSIGAVLVLLAPLVWTLLARVRRARRQREAMAVRALEASDDERRRIAAGLHDGVVQQLAALSFAASGHGTQAAGRGDTVAAEAFAGTARSVRGAMAELRSLLVDIYPPDLARGGLPAALRDLAVGAAPPGPGVAVTVEVQDDLETDLDLPEETVQALFRIAQESLRNAVRHGGAGGARWVRVTLTGGSDRVTLRVADDGTGFDLDSTLRRERDGHLGLGLLRDQGVRARLRVAVTTGPDGTTIETEVPR